MLLYALDIVTVCLWAYRLIVCTYIDDDRHKFIYIYTQCVYLCACLRVSIRCKCFVMSVQTIFESCESQNSHSLSRAILNVNCFIVFIVTIPMVWLFCYFQPKYLWEFVYLHLQSPSNSNLWHITIYTRSTLPYAYTYMRLRYT